MKRTTIKVLKKVSFFFLYFLLVATVALTAYYNLNPAIGGNSKGNELATIEKSPNYREGLFHNLEPTQVMTGREDENYFEVHSTLFSEDKKKPRTPTDILPSTNINSKAYAQAQPNSWLITWLGHSTLLIKTEDTTLIIDPILSKRASPSQFIGPKRFPSEVEYTYTDLPPIDAVLISHDHYDHLDYNTIVYLKDKVKKFYVPLGVKADLLRWKVKENKILVFDWYDSAQFQGLQFTFTPSRHFSGRGIRDRDKSLWGGWIVQSKSKSIFHSGDSGYSKELLNIGKKFGPFDFVFVECGAYFPNWAQIHLTPEETVQAAIDLRAKVLTPIHNSAFNLAPHHWKDPMERVLKASAKKNVVLATPLIGETFKLSGPIKKVRWWQGLF